MNKRKFFIFLNLLVLCVIAAGVTFQNSQKIRRFVSSHGKYPNRIFIAWKTKKKKQNAIYIKPFGKINEKINPTILTIPIDFPGDFAFTQDNNEIFLAGEDKSKNGVLVLLRTNNKKEYKIAWIYKAKNDAFYGVAYSKIKKRIYLLNKKGMIIFADYSPGKSSPTKWKILVEPALGLIPELSRAYEYRLKIKNDSEEPILQMFKYYYSFLGDSILIKHKKFGSPPFELINSDGIYKNYVFIDQRVINIGSKYLKVRGAPNIIVQAVQMEKKQYKVIGMCQLDEKGVGRIKISSLNIDSVYGLKRKDSDLILGPFFAPQLSFGKPDLCPNKFEILCIGNHALSSFIGNQYFTVNLDVKVSGNLKELAVYPAILMVGLYRISPVYELNNGKKVLIGEAVYPTKLVIDPNIPISGTYVNLPIPPDKSLANAIILYQWFIKTSPNDLYISNIAGIMIRGKEWIPPGTKIILNKASGSQESSQNNIQSNNVLKIKERVFDAFVSWMKSLESVKILEEETKERFKKMADKNSMLNLFSGRIFREKK